MPSGPSATALTAAESVTMENTISEACGHRARRARPNAMPAAISGSALSRDRFQPVTVCPAAISRGTISSPMAPRPTNPMIHVPSPRTSCPACPGIQLCSIADVDGRDKAEHDGMRP